jgi:hypothetical protein
MNHCRHTRDLLQGGYQATRSPQWDKRKNALSPHTRKTNGENTECLPCLWNAVSETNRHSDEQIPFAIEQTPNAVEPMRKTIEPMANAPRYFSKTIEQTARTTCFFPKTIEPIPSAQ